MKYALLFLLSFAVHAAESKVTELKIGTAGDMMEFDALILNAKAGAKVKLTFTNRNRKEGKMQHNWVLVKPGAANEVGVAGLVAGAAKQHVPNSPSVLAHTKLADPGESVSVTFTAPATPGDYPYICSYPGHYTVMRGTLHVEP